MADLQKNRTKNLDLGPFSPPNASPVRPRQRVSPVSSRPPAMHSVLICLTSKNPGTSRNAERTPNSLRQIRNRGTPESAPRAPPEVPPQAPAPTESARKVPGKAPGNIHGKTHLVYPGKNPEMYTRSSRSVPREVPGKYPESTRKSIPKVPGKYPEKTPQIHGKSPSV